MTFEEWLLSMGFADPASLDDIQRANLKLLYNEEYPDETPAEPGDGPAGHASTDREQLVNCLRGAAAVIVRTIELLRLSKPKKPE